MLCGRTVHEVNDRKERTNYLRRDVARRSPTYEALSSEVVHLRARQPAGFEPAHRDMLNAQAVSRIYQLSSTPSIKTSPLVRPFCRMLDIF